MNYLIFASLTGALWGAGLILFALLLQYNAPDFFKRWYPYYALFSFWAVLEGLNTIALF